jgi:hypothetical protein
VNVDFDYILLYSSEKDTNSNINTINVNQLTTYYLSEIRVYSPPINTYTNQQGMIDSEIVFIHKIRTSSYINNSVQDDIPSNVMFFIPSNIKISDTDSRDYTIHSLIENTTSFEPFKLKVQDILPRKSKFYSYLSNNPITTNDSVTTPTFIKGLSLIFDITPTTCIGINSTIIKQFTNTININAVKMCPTGNVCTIQNMSYAPMGLNPNTNNYYLSCGDVSPQNNNTPVSTSSLFSKYNINLNTIYSVFNTIIIGLISILFLWIIVGFIISFMNSVNKTNKLI